MQESRSGSFVNFEVRDNFQHFRSESYVQALQTMSVSSPSFGETRFADGSALKVDPEIYRASSNDDTHCSSAPSSPKILRGRGSNTNAQKSSTLPNHAVREIHVGFPKPKKSGSLSIGSFFRKLSPRSKRSKEKKGDKPWIVVEFSQSEIDSVEKEDSSGGSSQSIELAAKSKESYIRSLVSKDSTFLSSKKAIARSANDIHSGKTPISNLVTDASVSFSSVANTPVRNSKYQTSELSPRKSLQDLKVKDSKRSSLIVFDPDSISNRTINSFSANKTSKLKKSQVLIDVSSSEESEKAESQVTLRGKERGTPIKSALKTSGGGNCNLPSFCVTKSNHNLNESEKQRNSLENGFRAAQPPRTLNLATSFVDCEVNVKKMNSIESIGVCSLDAESATHSDHSLSPSNDHHAIADDHYTSSAYTLKSTSLILSNGSCSSPVRRELTNPELRVEQFGDVTDRAAPQDDQDLREERFRSYAYLYITPDKHGSRENKNNEHHQSLIELDPGHLPSYLGISCAISGYSGYSRYCHSRDNSPARVNSKLAVATQSSKSSPGDNREMHHGNNEISVNGGSKPRSKTESYICNKYFSGDETRPATSEAKQIFVSSQSLTISKNEDPIRNVSARKHSPVRADFGNIKGFSNGLNGHHDEEKSLPTTYHRGEEFNSNNSPFTDGPKSLVQQRIESLFGQPASQVVQGGAIRVSRTKSRTPVDGNTSLRSPSCPPQAFRPSSRSPPVFRHITQDFKQQLRNATVPTKLSPVKATTPQQQLSSPNKQLALASMTISTPTKEINKITTTSQNANGSSKRPQTLRAASEPKTAFPTALSIVSPISAVETIAVENVETVPNQVGHGHQFIAKIDAATSDIRRQIKEVEEDTKLPGVPEEALGKLLSAAGKANLLIDQKFAQFRKLCEKNISPDPSEPFPTTNEDLAGFWDMVHLQVDNVNETFSNLKKLKENDWKEETVPYSRSKSQSKSQQPKRVIVSPRTASSKSNPTSPVHSAKASEKAKAREEQRKKLMEAKKRGRQQNPGETSADIAIFTPDQAAS